MKVLITRAKSQATEFAQYLESYGFTCVFFPTIEIVEPDSWEEVDEKIKQIDKYTDIIFTSTNAVKFFFDRFTKFHALENLRGKRFHADGTKTKEEIEKYGIGNRHIFNLGHGIQPDTPVENVKVLVETVKTKSKNYHKINATQSNSFYQEFCR